MIAVSLNVGGGVRLIKQAKPNMCLQNTTHTNVPDMVSYSGTVASLNKHSWNKQTKMDHTFPLRVIISGTKFVPLKVAL